MIQRTILLSSDWNRSRRCQFCKTFRSPPMFAEKIKLSRLLRLESWDECRVGKWGA